MSGDVLVVTSGKGGVGKTTTSVNLAIALRQQGHSVAVLDADLGMPNVAAFLSTDGETTLHDVLAGEADTEEAIVEVGDGLGFVFGEQALDRFADAEPARLEAVVEALADRYQYVLVDTGGGLSYEGVYPIELADGVLLVTSPIPAAIADTRKSKQLAERLGVPVRGVIVTRVDEGTNPESIASELDVDFLGAVPSDDAVVESATKRQPLVAFAPESAATIAYYRVADTLSDPATAELDPLDAARKPSTSEGAEESASSPVAESTNTDGSSAADQSAQGDRTQSDESEGTKTERAAEDEGMDTEKPVADSKPDDRGKDERPPSEADSGSNDERGFFGRLLGRFR